MYLSGLLDSFTLSLSLSKLKNTCFWNNFNRPYIFSGVSRIRCLLFVKKIFIKHKGNVVVVEKGYFGDFKRNH